MQYKLPPFLDDERTTQLFIGETSVQVWYRKGVNSKRELKYIWTNPTNRKLSIKSLEIGQREFKVSLAWNDVPAALNAPMALVNDLDLEVSTAEGKTILF